jgi:hypothetical protein
MDAKQAVQEVLDRVKTRTGFDVVEQPDVLSTHLIRYSPAAASTPDYVVCCQCGFILRMFEMAPSDRFSAITTTKGSEEVGRLLAQRLGSGVGARLPKHTVEGWSNQVYEGLITQLCSVPLGLRVDDWLLREFPGLAEQQKRATQRQLNDNAAVLQPQIRQFSPEKVYRANVSMLAAFASFWARAWADPRLMVPYRTAGLLAGGEELLGLWDSVPAEPKEDRALIDAWGRKLGLEDWYEFVPRPLRGGAS